MASASSSSSSLSTSSLGQLVALALMLTVIALFTLFSFTQRDNAAAESEQRRAAVAAQTGRDDGDGDDGRQRWAAELTYESAMETLNAIKNFNKHHSKARAKSRKKGTKTPSECDVDAHMQAASVRPENESDGKTLVFLLAHGRSGSTLATTFFFSTADCFYLDEPLNAAFHEIQGLDAVDKAAELLSCAFADQRDGSGDGARRINETEFLLFERRCVPERGNSLS